MTTAHRNEYDHDFDEWDDFEAAVAARTAYSTADFTSRNRAGRWTSTPRRGAAGTGQATADRHYPGSAAAGRSRQRTGRPDPMGTGSRARFNRAVGRIGGRATASRAGASALTGSSRPGTPGRGELYDRWSDAQADTDLPARHPLAAADLEEAPEFPLHEDTDVPTLRLVEQRRRLAALAGVSRRRWTVAALIVLVGFAVVLVNVSLHVEMARAQFRLTDLSQREVAAEKAYDKKRLEVARLEAPQRIIDEAKAAGMVEPDKVTPVRPAAVPAAPEGEATGNPQPAPNSQTGWQELKPQIQRGATK